MQAAATHHLPGQDTPDAGKVFWGESQTVRFEVLLSGLLLLPDLQSGSSLDRPLVHPCQELPATAPRGISYVAVNPCPPDHNAGHDLPAVRRVGPVRAVQLRCALQLLRGGAQCAPEVDAVVQLEAGGVQGGDRGLGRAG